MIKVFYSLIGVLALMPALARSADLSASETISGQFRTYTGQSLSPENPATSITFEPTTAVTFPSQTTLSLLATIDRPTNKYEELSVPRVRARVKQGVLETDLATFSTELSASALDLNRWSNEGAMVRTAFGLAAVKSLLDKSLVITAKAVPFYQLNAYAQTTDGRTKPVYGVGETIGVEYHTGRTTLSADIGFTQAFTAVWKNNFSTSQEIAYNFTDAWSIGAGHELLGSFVDESTGRYSSLKFFDSRQSRISAFLGYEF